MNHMNRRLGTVGHAHVPVQNLERMPCVTTGQSLDDAGVSQVEAVGNAPRARCIPDQ